MIFSICLSFIPNRSEAFIGNVGREFCEDVQKFGPILNAFSTVQWPVAGFPGITLGLAQNTSVLLDLCNIVMQIEQLKTGDAAFFAATKLNQMTGNKWNHHLKMADSTWNLANSVFDFDSGQARAAAFKSVGTYRAMNDSIKTSYSWYHKTVNGKDAELGNRTKREGEMRKYAGVAYRRAVLADAINCPEPAGKKNYSKIYSQKVAPEAAKMEEEKEELNFLKDRLLVIGPKMMNSHSEIQEYIQDIEQLETAGVSYDVSEGTQSVSTYKPVKKEAAATGGSGEGFSSAEADYKKTEIKMKKQRWKAKLYSDVFQDFIKKWGPQWHSWVTNKFLSSGIRGIFAGPRYRVESEFVNLYYECSSRKLMKGVDTNRPDYQKEQRKRVENCKKSTKANQKKSGNLLKYYVEKFKTSLYKYKTAQAKIWTAESTYLGKNRSLSVEDAAEGFQREKVSCKNNILKPAEMQKLALKQQEVENEYNEIISKQVMKQTVMAEEKAKAEFKQKDEIRKKQSFAERQTEQLRQDMGGGLAPVAPSGGM